MTIITGAETGAEGTVSGEEEPVLLQRRAEQPVISSRGSDFLFFLHRHLYSRVHTHNTNT